MAKSLLDPSFRYVSANDTDLRKTFARIKRENAEANKQRVTAITQPLRPIFERNKK